MSSQTIDILRVGSRALRVTPPRPPGPDTDYIATPRGFERLVSYWESIKALLGDFSFRPGKVIVPYWSSFFPEQTYHYEVELAEPGSTGEELLAWVQHYPGYPGWHGYNSSIGRDAGMPILLALKLTHRYRDSVHFEKTRGDILWFEENGVVTPVGLAAWMARREKETLAKPPSLALSKREFFTDNVKYVYDHDSLHRAMAFGERPAYLSFQKEGAEVMVDKKKWDTLPLQVQLNSVMEESMVIALERHQIPTDFRHPPEVSYEIALRKVCTRLSSGWWREFAWRHYDVCKVSPAVTGYVERFKRALSAGVVRPHMGRDDD